MSIHNNFFDSTVCKSDIVTDLPFLLKNAIQQDQYQNFNKTENFSVSMPEPSLQEFIVQQDCLNLNSATLFSFWNNSCPSGQKIQLKEYRYVRYRTFFRYFMELGTLRIKPRKKNWTEFCAPKSRQKICSKYHFDAIFVSF